MNQYQLRTRTVVTRELVIDTPFYWKELGYATSRIQQELGEKAQYDDAVTITVGDDCVIFSYEVSDEVVPGG